MDGEDFELVIKNQSSTGLQAVLIYQGQSDPFAFFFGHKITEQEYSGSLVFLDPAESLEDLPWEPVVLNIAGILDANLGLQLFDVEVLCRFDPVEVSQPQMRQNRISRTTVDFESYELQIEAIETEVFEQFDQQGEVPDDQSYWPVAKAECLMDSDPPVIAVLMQARGVGLSSAFGGDSSVYRSRRGIERQLMRFTVLLVVLFVLFSLVGYLQAN
jgi:protein translocase SecG subunit